MPTAAETLGLFGKTFPRYLHFQCRGKLGPAWLTAIGTTVWIGRTLQISSIIGGSVAVRVGLITHLAFKHLGNCYLRLGGTDQPTLANLMAASFVQPITIGGLAAAIAGHPISFLGRIALAGIFYGSTRIIVEVCRKVNMTRAGATAL